MGSSFATAQFLILIFQVFPPQLGDWITMEEKISRIQGIKVGLQNCLRQAIWQAIRVYKTFLPDFK